MKMGISSGSPFLDSTNFDSWVSEVEDTGFLKSLNFTCLESFFITTCYELIREISGGSTCELMPPKQPMFPCYNVLHCDYVVIFVDDFFCKVSYVYR